MKSTGYGFEETLSANNDARKGIFSCGFRLERISFPLRRKMRKFSVDSNIIHSFVTQWSSHFIKSSHV